MPTQNRYEELCDAFKNEMQEYVNEGFRASDCFPFVFANLIDKAAISAPDRNELQRELSEWTAKIM